MPQHAAACFTLHTWVLGGPVFQQNGFPVPRISVPGPKHTFRGVALSLESCTGGGGGFCTGFFPQGKIPHLSQKIKGKIPHLPNLECIANKGDPGIAIPKRHTIQQSNAQ